MTAPTITDVRQRAGDLLKRFQGGGSDIYRDAYTRGMSLSAHLEQLDPSEGYNDGLDAFGRLLKEAGIRTRTMPEYGVYADEFDAFNQKGVRSLAPEWLARQWRAASTGKPASTRGLYQSSDATPGSALYPIVNAAQARTDKQIAPAIPVSELVAVTTPITGGVYQAFYLKNDTDNQRMVRVAEGTDVPKAKLTPGNNTIRVRKFGRALEVSYEQLRRMRFDMIALHIQRMAAQGEADKVAIILDVLINGDGNPSTAAQVFNLTTLDPATTANNLTLLAWLAFKMKFANPYVLSTALAQEGPALKLQLLNTGSANIPLVQVQGASNFGAFRQINRGLAEGVGLGWSSDAPANTVVGFDSSMAVERVTEIGSNIQEVERYISRQTEELVMTESEGFAIFDPSAAKILNLAA